MRYIFSSTQSAVINFCISFLLIIGLVAIFSSTFTAETIAEGKGTINKQLIFIVIGLILFYLISRFDYKFLQLVPVTTILYLLLIGSLIYVLFSGDAVRETNRWISLGFINIQPSEYAKIVLIICNSIIFSKSYDFSIIASSKVSSAKRFVGIVLERIQKLMGNDFFKLFLSAFVNLPVIFLVYKQPALGNTILILLIWLSLFFVFSDQKRVLVYLAALGVGIYSGLSILVYSINIGGDNLDIGFLAIGFVLILIVRLVLRFKLIAVVTVLLLGLGLSSAGAYIWQGDYIKDYQKTRIESFLSPADNASSSGWQVNQSKIAVGSGEISGKGFLRGSQSKLRYLPFAYTDFIFAAFSEEFGFIGSLLILSIFFILLLNLLFSVSKIEDHFGALIVSGVFFMTLYHIFVNVGMNVGIMPVTGITLPLVSYGGSSIFVNLIALGIVNSIILRNSSVDSSRQMVLTSGGFWGVKSF